MDAYGIIGTAGTALVCLIVGVRLFFLWLRTRELPELLMSLSFLTGGVLANLVLPTSSLDSDAEALFLARQVLFRLFYVIGRATIAIAVWRIFRPDDLWAKGLVALILLQLTTYLFRGLILPGIDPRSLLTHPLYYWDTFGQLAPYVWITWESVRYQLILRRRWRVGLEKDRILADRMLLWGIGLGAISVADVAFEANLFLNVFVGRSLPVSLFSFFGGGICATALWLAFFPPKHYLTSVRGRAA